MDFSKIAARIASKSVQRYMIAESVPVKTFMKDGSGEDVEYLVEVSDSSEIQRVTRVDTNQEVDAEAFQTVFGKRGLEKLIQESSELFSEIEEARGEEELEGDESSNDIPSEEFEEEPDSPEEAAEEPAEEPAEDDGSEPEEFEEEPEESY